jgi:hypothetical protein
MKPKDETEGENQKEEGRNILVFDVTLGFSPPA